jgi:hypothetical protein
MSLLHGGSTPSASRSPSVAQSVTSTVSSGADLPVALLARELLIVNILDIDIAVTKQVAAIHLRDYYRKYTTILTALSKRTTAAWQHPDSGWEGKPPAGSEVIQIFIGKSTWHDSWLPKFNRVVQHFPEMLKWLKNDSNKQLTKKLWGQDEDQPFKLKDLQFWMDNGTLDISGSKESKGKAKAKDSTVDRGGASGSGEGKKKKKKVASSTR